MSRPSHTTSPTKWLGPILFTALFLGLQVSVAVVKLAGPRPVRFGWHMFSARAPGRVFLVISSDGRRQEIHPDHYFGKTRPDMNLEELLVGHICGSRPDVAEVVAERTDGTSSQSYRCR